MLSQFNNYTYSQLERWTRSDMNRTVLGMPHIQAASFESVFQRQDLQATNI